MIKVERGRKYPGDFVEGIQFAAFMPGGSLLRVAMPDITKTEEKQYRYGAVKFRFEVNSSDIVTHWQFGTEPVSSAHFDAKIAQKANQLVLDDVDMQSRLLISLHLIDSASGICRGLRSFTISTKATADLTAAIMDQLSSVRP